MWRGLTLALGLLGAGCATVPRAELDRALSACRGLAGPDAGKGHGEVWFWFQSERAEASRKLWSAAGRRVVASAMAAATDPIDRACLRQLQAEAESRELLRE